MCPAQPNSPERSTGIASLHRAFAIALSSEKFQSSGKASSLLKRAKNEKAKKEIISEQLAVWREGCGVAIRKFFPQYIELGLAYSHLVKAETVEWAEEMAWIPLSGQCGVSKADELHPHRSDSVNWWLAVSIDGNFGVNVPGNKPWHAPAWLAANVSEMDRLIEEWSQALSAQICRRSR